MIEIKNKDGNILFTTDLKPEELFLNFNGKLQEITQFGLSGNVDIPNDIDNPDVKILEISLEGLLYEYWWGIE